MRLTEMLLAILELWSFETSKLASNFRKIAFRESHTIREKSIFLIGY
jgi:hypothetical protein